MNKYDICLWVIHVINSCKTLQQLENAKNLIISYHNMGYDDMFGLSMSYYDKAELLTQANQLDKL